MSSLLWKRDFLLWTLTGENGNQLTGLTGLTTALGERLARSHSLAAEEEQVAGSKVPLDLLQLKSGHLESLDFERLFFVTSCRRIAKLNFAIRLQLVEM